MVKFQSLAQFPVNHFHCTVVFSLILSLRLFGAFVYNVIGSMVKFQFVALSYFNL